MAGTLTGGTSGAIQLSTESTSPSSSNFSKKKSQTNQARPFSTFHNEPYRSVAALKLKELDDRFHLFSLSPASPLPRNSNYSPQRRTNTGPQASPSSSSRAAAVPRYRCTVDLAAAPGGFSQVAVERMSQQLSPQEVASLSPSSASSRCLCIAVDLQRIYKPIAQTVTVQANILDHHRLNRIVSDSLNVFRSAHRSRSLQSRKEDKETEQHWRSDEGMFDPRRDEEDDLALLAPQVVLHDGVSVAEGHHALSVQFAQTSMALSCMRWSVDQFLAHRETRMYYAQEKQRRRTEVAAAGNSLCLSESDDSDVFSSPPPVSANDDVEGDSSLVITTAVDEVFVTKAMHCAHFDQLLRAARRWFRRVDVWKPPSSRPDSRETYLVCRGVHLPSARNTSSVKGGFDSHGRPKHSHHRKTAAGAMSELGVMRRREFSLCPRPEDISGERQVIWHCHGCKKPRSGPFPCPECHS